MDANLQVKIDNALIACRLVKNYLVANGRTVWIPYFDAIKDALVAADPDRIQKERERLPMTNMGSFGEDLLMDSELRAMQNLLSAAARQH